MGMSSQVAAGQVPEGFRVDYSNAPKFAEFADKSLKWDMSAVFVGQMGMSVLSSHSK